jgi:CheY-like chemotaxis protein
MKIARARILVVDDEPVMLKYVTDTLRRLGIQSIEACSDGKEALQTMASFKPDLVLTDIHMKPMGGPEVCAAVALGIQLGFRSYQGDFHESRCRQ